MRAKIVLLAAQGLPNDVIAARLDTPRQIVNKWRKRQRKVLTPNDFSSLSQLEQCLMDFQKRYEQTASPFQWTFTRHDLCALLAKLQPRAAAAAA